MNATALHRQVRSDIAVTSIARRPRAIVVTVGEKLEHYTELYHSLQCSTISIDTTSIKLQEPTELAISITRETARLVRMAQLSEMGMGQHVPVLIHVMGSSGVKLIEALEQQVEERGLLNTKVARVPPPRFSGKHFNMNESARSLFTNETDPMSSDDEDDDSNCDESSVVGEVSPLLYTRPMLQRQSLHQRAQRHLPCSPPSVHRIDVERTAISFQQASNPNRLALERDVHTFSSHLSMMLWDMPPPCKIWSLKAILTRILVFLLFLWRCIQQWALGVRLQCANPRIAGLSLTRQHALAYVNDQDDSAKCILQQANVVLWTKLHGTRKQHGAEYVRFVRQALDRISSLPSDDSDDDGFSSDEED